VDGAALLDEIARRIKKRKGKDVKRAELAKELGVTEPVLDNYGDGEITPKQVVNLMEKFAKVSEKRVMEQAIVPIVEFFYLDPRKTKQGKSWKLFATDDGKGGSHPYLSGLYERLTQTHGIYVFHDSRGRAIYVGKAQRLFLWEEMNNAFNRKRGEVQSIKRAAHPTNRIPYKGPEKKKRPIVRQKVALHEIASYVSAYQVADGLIRKFEAVIVRAFANDLLNVRIENF
jgi:hypothetical protein